AAGMDRASSPEEDEGEEAEAAPVVSVQPAASAPAAEAAAPPAASAPRAVPSVPRAPLGSATGVGAPVEVEPVDPERPVPMLPRELRRRIDHYIRQRLDEIMREAEGEKGE